MKKKYVLVILRVNQYRLIHRERHGNKSFLQYIFSDNAEPDTMLRVPYRMGSFRNQSLLK